jgi:DNA-binding transcriptional regulator YhcF (GntR family)
MNRGAVIEFHLDARSGVAPYLQLIHQVRQALRLGLLREGDQLPTVKEVVARLAINPNTVLKAYRQLEYEGLAAARPGIGHVRDRDPERWVPRRLPATASGPAEVARQGAPGGTGRREHRCPLPEHLSVRS